MQNNAVDLKNQVIVTNVMPLFVRIMIGGAGALCCVLVVKELGGALWPISFLTLFFGFILLGGLSVGFIFVIGAIFGPDETWTIAPRQITIRSELREHSKTEHFVATDFTELTIEKQTDNDGPDCYFILVSLRPGLDRPAFMSLGAGAAFARSVADWVAKGWFPAMAPKEHRVTSKMRSPKFTTLARAKEALAIFEGRR